MKIVYLGAGAAGRICGACFHDNTLVTALLARGEEVLLTPTYTPIRTDERNVAQARVFFGGLNVFLQEKSALFRHTPWFLDALLDSPALLNFVSRRSAGMAPAKLGALTVSTLGGERGRQRKELDKLVRWLADEVRPDVVHLSNVMLVGAARQIRERLGTPVVCSLVGEDIFLEQLTPPHYQQARDLLKERSRDVDAFIALNHYYADLMSDYLAVDRQRIEVIRHGLNLAGHGSRSPSAPGEATIGYFARVAIEKGLHLLAEAFILLCQEPNLPKLRLRVAGYKSSADEAYFATVQARIQAAGLGDRFEYVGEVDREEKIAFLQSLDVMSVPTIYHESKGISILEAMANGVPVVLPAHGTFPELIADTSGGLLHEPENPAALAAALRQLLQNRPQADELGRNAQQAIRQRYTAEGMAAETADLYRRVLERTANPAAALARSSTAF